MIFPLASLGEGEYRATNGVAIPLCILHKLDPEQSEEAQASGVVGGLSLCAKHIDIAVAFLMKGYPIEVIMHMQYEGHIETAYRILEQKFIGEKSND